MDLERNLWQLNEELRGQTYQPGMYTNFYIYEPKRRLVSAAPFRDRVVPAKKFNFCQKLNFYPRPVTSASDSHLWLSRADQGQQLTRLQHRQRTSLVIPYISGQDIIRAGAHRSHHLDCILKVLIGQVQGLFDDRVVNRGC